MRGQGRVLVPAALSIAVSLSGSAYAAAQEGKTAGKDTGPRSAAARVDLESLAKESAQWSPKDIEKLRKTVGLIGPGPQSAYPAPKFPKITKPKSVDDLMPKARQAIRQTGGLAPIGLSEPGDKILIVVPVANRGGADPMVQEAVKRAFAERNIKADIKYDYELLGAPKDDLKAIAEVELASWKPGESEKEVLHMMKSWRPGQKWLKENHPELYVRAFRDLQYPKPEMAQLARDYEDKLDEALIKYLDEHPEYDKFFYRQGGPTKTRTRMKHHGKRYFGNYAYLNYFDIMSNSGSFPSDVWQMLETKTIEPLRYVDRIEASDPEGTAIYADLTQEEASAWASGVYQQGHLYMFPLQATGRYPYSIVEYPAYEGKWLEPVQVAANGVTAGTNSHANTQPRIEVWFKDGYISNIKGGGLYGEIYRQLLQYPGINSTTWPFAKKPGWWWFFEAGTATNPKFYKNPTELLAGRNSSERLAGGTIHWSVGLELKHGPEKNGKLSPKTREFARETGLPIWHGQHIHSLLPTYQVRLRDSERWMTLIEHGTIMATSDPEVRALSARYGNPSEVLSRDYYPPLPGINAEGDYQSDYLKDPGAYWAKWSNQILDGTSPYFEKSQPKR